MKKNLLDKDRSEKNRTRWLLLSTLTILLTLLSIQNTYATLSSQHKVNLRMGETTYKLLFEEIRKQTGCIVMYNDASFNKNDRLRADYGETTLENALSKALSGSGMTYEINGEFIILVKAKSTTPQSQNVKTTPLSGRVINHNKEPMAGVSVLIKGTSKGIITDEKGEWNLTVENRDLTLIFSFIGMKSREITVQKGTQNIEIVLEEEISDLDDVVVVGYGTTTKKDLTGSVARFDSKIIEESTASNLAHMMQGQVAGLSILNGSGAPGVAAKLEIRGVPSLSGTTAPLIVVDNVPMPEGFDINELNPDDVKNIDILKGASSAAIYGSRAAAGVIMITTKFGSRNQKPEINYSYDFSISSLTHQVRGLTTDEYKLLLTEAVANSVIGFGNYENLNDYPFYKTMTAPGYFGEENTNWMNLIMQNGSKQQHKVSVRGGTDHVGYTASFGYTDETGEVKATGFKRYTYDLGFNADINKWIRANVKISGVDSDQKTNGGSLSMAVGTRPDIKAYNDDGSYYIHTYLSSSGSTIRLKNPIAELDENTTNYKNNNNRITANLEFQFLPELKLLTQYTHQERRGTSVRYLSSNTYEGSAYGGTQKGKGSQTESTTKNSELEARLTYTNTFSSDHSLSAVAAITYTDDEQSSWGLTATDYSDDYIQNAIYQATNLRYTNGNALGSILMSFVGRAEYKYKDRYLLTASIRSDGSSRFAPKYRWGTFPSVAAGWIISDEKFMQPISKFVTFLKLRAGWGKTGNGFVGEYGWRTLYTTGDYQGKPSIIPSQIGNDELKWESTQQWDLGLDFGLMDAQRIRGSINLYKKETSGLLYPLTVAPSTGLSTTDVNYADIQNKGIEFEVNADILRDKEWKWSVGFNIGKNLNKITGLDARYISYLGSTSLGNTVIEEGRSMGLIFGFKTEGIFQSWEQVAAYEARNKNYAYQEQYSYRRTQPGDLIYSDLSGDGRVNKTWGQNEDKTVLGCSRPDFEGGFNTRVSWRGFTLSVQGTFSYGAQKIWNGEANSFNFMTDANVRDIALKRWTPTNRQNRYPSVRYNFYYNDFCDFSVYDASYVKIQNINLEYNLPKKLVDRTRVLGRISVFGSITNAFTITSYPGPSPESFSTDAIAGASVDSDTYPTTRTFNFGVKITIK